MKLIAKILLIWASIILGPLYLLGSIAWAADAYLKIGWTGVAVVSAIASTVPALILGIVMTELSDRKAWRQRCSRL